MARQRRGRQALQLAGRHREGRLAAAARDIDQIGDDGRGGRPGAGPPPLADVLADEIAFGHDGIVDALDMGDGRAQRHHAGMDALLDAEFGRPRDAQQLDAVAELLGEGDIHRRDIADAIHLHPGEIDLAAEGDAREDGELVGGVDPVDIEAGIRLGIAQALGIGQHIGEFAAGLAHHRQDVVAGAVEDAVDALDAIGGQALAQGLDDGDAPRHGRLIAEAEALGLRLARQRRAVMGEQRLVRGHHMLAGGKGGLQKLARHALGAADELDHDIDLRQMRERQGIVMPGIAREIDAAVALAIARRDGTDLDRAPAAPRQILGMKLEQLDRPGPDIAESGDRDAQGLRHSAMIPRIAFSGRGRFRRAGFLLRPSA